MVKRKDSVNHPADRDGGLPYQLESLDILRSIVLDHGGEDDPDGRALLVAVDLAELAIARAYHDLGRKVAPWHALRLCARWRIPPPTWVADALAAAAEALWRGAALPTPAAVRDYQRDLDRLRAAADLRERKRKHREDSLFYSASASALLDRIPGALDAGDAQEAKRLRELVDHDARMAGAPERIGDWRKRWGRRLGLAGRSLERWGKEWEPGPVLGPVLERLSDPERVAEWEGYVRTIAKRKGLKSLSETIAEIDAEARAEAARGD